MQVHPGYGRHLGPRLRADLQRVGRHRAARRRRLQPRSADRPGVRYRRAMISTTPSCSSAVAQLARGRAARLDAGATPPASQVFDAAALLKDLETLSADDMQGRAVGTAGGEKARAYVVERFKAAGVCSRSATATRWPFTFAGGGAGSQTRSRRQRDGRIARHEDRRTLHRVSAHYDHIGVRNGAVFNGADDNASGHGRAVHDRGLLQGASAGAPAAVRGVRRRGVRSARLAGVRAAAARAARRRWRST